MLSITVLLWKTFDRRRNTFSNWSRVKLHAETCIPTPEGTCWINTELFETNLCFTADSITLWMRSVCLCVCMSVCSWNLIRNRTHCNWKKKNINFAVSTNVALMVWWDKIVTHVLGEQHKQLVSSQRFEETRDYKFPFIFMYCLLHLYNRIVVVANRHACLCLQVEQDAIDIGAIASAERQRAHSIVSHCSEPFN